MTRIVTDENFNEVLNEGKPVVLDFWAEWCGPCRMVGPVIEELANEYEGRIIFGKIDVDENNELTAQYEIRSVPTVLFIKDQQVVDKLVGAAPKANYIKKIEQIM
ncbi:MAG: thioredoxin [Tannerella sp.]|jgi:thioredoxin 1|nr:thioredoxin [Tannerella sp.]